MKASITTKLPSARAALKSEFLGIAVLHAEKNAVVAYTLGYVAQIRACSEHEI